MESSNMNYSNRSQPTLKIPYSLLGKNITVYRGGPESKTGKLMDVKQDYLVIYSDNKIIYYQAEHIKSITEDSKTNAMQTNSGEEEEPFFYQGDNFISLLKNFLNRKIQIDQGGPDSKQGTLLQLGSDFLVLSTEDDGVIYYNLHHIKSIIELEKNLNNIGADTEESSSYWQNEESAEEMMSNILMGSDFHHLCSLMSHKWVSVNRKGPEALEGILVDSSDGFFTLANNQELYRIHPFHVRNISIGPKGAMKQQQQQNNNNQEQMENNQAESSSNGNYLDASSRTGQQQTTSGNRGTSRRTSRRTSSSSSSRTSRGTSRRTSRGTSRRTSRGTSRRTSRGTSRRTSRGTSRRTSRRTTRRTSRGRNTSRRRHRSSNSSFRTRRRRRTSSSPQRTGRRLESIIRAVNFDWRPMS